MAQPTVQPVADPALDVPVELLEPCPFQTRVFTDNDPALADLATSIAKLGVLQNLIARPHPDDDGRFQLASGERRWRAAQRAKLDTVPVKVLDLDDTALAEVCAIENLQREQLHPLEEADAIRLLVDRAGWDHAAVADQLGKSHGFVGRRARLANLSPAWREAVADPEHPASRWSASHLLLIARLEPDEQDRLLKTKPNVHWWWTASVTTLRQQIADLTQQLGRAPFSKTSDTLVAEAGACIACPKRSSRHPGLFDDADDAAVDSGDDRIPPGDRCLDPGCWRQKTAAYVQQREATLHARYEDLIVLALESGSGAHCLHNFRKAKKSAKGALPALFVEGANVGEFSWVVPLRETRTTPATRRDAKTVVRQRRKALSDALLERLEQLPAPKVHVVAAWAIAHRAVFAYHSLPELGLLQHWADVEELLKLPRARLYEQLWKLLVLPRLRSRLQDIAQYRDLDAKVRATSDDEGPTLTVRDVLQNELDRIFPDSVDLAALEAEIADQTRDRNPAQATVAAA